jgi:osmotically-inducible protein OsmY
VLRGDVVVGIVSRANLIQQLAAGDASTAEGDDESIRKAIDKVSKSATWMTHGNLNATVRAGTVEMWGWVDSEAERRAIRIAMEEIPGVHKVSDHLGFIAPYLRGA